MFKVSEAAALAMHTMVRLAAEPTAVVTVAQLASEFSASEAHLSKVLQQLAKEDLVRSVRGPKGGFSLNQPPEQVTLLRVYELMDGTLVPHACLFRHPMCDGDCLLGDLLKDMNAKVREHFEKTSLADLARRKKAAQ